MQNYSRIFDYQTDYWKLLYDTYQKHAVSYLLTYYNINKTTTVWDNDKLNGGSYEPIGSLSGIKWNKYLLLPVFFITETSTVFDAQDIGYVNEGTIEFVIPSEYNIIPYPGDIIKLEQGYLVKNTEDDVFALYEIQGIKKQSPYDRTFWQLNGIVHQSRTTTELDLQVSNTYVFYDYDKKIHTVDDSISLTRMMNKNEELRSRLKTMYDMNSGYYFL